MKRLPVLAVLAVLLGLAGALLTAAAPAVTPAQPSGRIVFSDLRAKPRRADIYSIRVDGRDRRKLTARSRAQAYGPIPSPDGARILCHFGGESGGEDSIFVMRADGRGPRWIADGDHPIWSPDGRHVAFDAYEALPGHPNTSFHWIFVADADGRHLRRVARGQLPSWSPDGRTIAFVDSKGSAESVVMVMRTNGSGRRRIAPNLTWFGEDNRPDPPRWSPEGRYVAFAAAHPQARLASIAVAPTDGGRGRRVALGQHPRWSSDGKLLAFTSLDRGGIAVVRPNGRGLRWLTARGAPDAERPVWSPNGSRIAFVRLWPRQQLFVIDRNGHGLRQVTHESSAASFLGGHEWLDGRTLLFSSQVARDLDLFSMHPDGSGARRLRSDGVDDIQPSWSPDGSKIAFTHRDLFDFLPDFSSVIEVMDADGSHVRRLAGGLVTPAFAPSWSPDGRWIAFIAQRKAEVESLFLMRADGSGVHRIVDVGPPGREYSNPSLDWSPDSRRIVFAHNDGRGTFGGLDLAIVLADGGTPVDLTYGGDACGGEFSAPAWSPDGSTIAYIEGESYGFDCDDVELGLRTVSPDGTNAGKLSVPGELGIGHPFDDELGPFDPSVAWSADSAWLVFAGALGIQIVRPNGSGWSRISSGAYPDWTSR